MAIAKRKHLAAAELAGESVNDYEKAFEEQKEKVSLLIKRLEDNLGEIVDEGVKEVKKGKEVKEDN